MPKPDENDFVRRLQEGDEESFRQFVTEYKKKAYVLAYSLTGSHHESLELSQEAFIKVYFSIKDFKSKSSLYTWFYRILINLCLRYNQRKHKLPRLFFTKDSREAEENADAVNEETTAGPGNLQSNPLQVLLDKELSREIDRAVQSLPEYQRLVFILRQIEGFSINQTAEILACRPGTVKTHLFRAVRKLRQLLKPYLKA